MYQRIQIVRLFRPVYMYSSLCHFVTQEQSQLFAFQLHKHCYRLYTLCNTTILLLLYRGFDLISYRIISPFLGKIEHVVSTKILKIVIQLNTCLIRDMASKAFVQLSLCFV